MEGATDQPPGAGAPEGLRGELHRLPREGTWDATHPVYEGAPTLLWGGAPSPCPHSISQAAIFAAVYDRYLGMEPH
jgi:hypothetical protein